jgi:hypothetical protein
MLCDKSCRNPVAYLLVARPQWLMPVILATQEAEILDKYFLRPSILKSPITKIGLVE